MAAMSTSVAQPAMYAGSRRSPFAGRNALRSVKVVKASPLRAAPVRAAVAEPASAPSSSGGVDRGSGHEVHKFGGTCVGSFERISGVCDLLIESAKSGVKTFGVVSAMGVATKGEPKVTDCLINATDMAAARNPAYEEELVKLEHKHRSTAEALLTIPEELSKYMDNFMAELEDLRAMLRAMSIAGTSTQAFADFRRRARRAVDRAAVRRGDPLQGLRRGVDRRARRPRRHRRRGRRRGRRLRAIQR